MTDDTLDGLDGLVPAAEPAFPPPELALPLRRPVEGADGPVTHLNLREPTSAEWEQIMAEPEHTRRRKAVSLVAGVPMATCGKIQIGDLVRAERYLIAFFDIGQAITDW